MMDPSFIFHVLIGFGAFQAIFLAFIFFTRKKNGLANRLLGLFLVIEGITLVERLLAETKLITAIPHFLGVSYPINFIKPPILFFLVLAMTHPKYRFKRKQVLHFIPFFLILLMNLPFYAESAENKLALVAAFITYVPTYDSFNFWFFLSFFFYIGFYLWMSISRLSKYTSQVKNHKPASWYLSVLKLYALGLSAGCLYFIVRPSGFIEIPYFNIISMLVMTFLIQSIAYRFITKADIFNGNQAPVLENTDQLKKDEQLIRKQLEQEKVFLDDTLTLERFSESVQLPKKYVSELINQRFGCSFREIINHYRVEEAKNAMQEKAGSSTTLIQIGMASGFNNKVSFYRTFKRFTGKSPSEYAEDLNLS